MPYEQYWAYKAAFDGYDLQRLQCVVIYRQLQCLARTRHLLTTCGCSFGTYRELAAAGQQLLQVMLMGPLSGHCPQSTSAQYRAAARSVV